MSDDAELADDTGGDLPPEIIALLARPATWDEPPPGLEDSIVRAIGAAPAPVAVTALDAVRARRDRTRATWPWWLAAAAAAVVVIAGAVVIGRSGDDQRGLVIALAATDLAPGASATAELASTPAGLKIVLDVDGLPGAADGEMYEAWISDGDVRVSAGTFHLRGGDPPIELWAGTADPAFTSITVTIEPIDGDNNSSGRVVLRGDYELASP
jgi:anti-sigma-K factor RskA